MNVRPKCSFGGEKTLADADRLVLAGVYPHPILLLFMGERFCFMNNSGQESAVGTELETSSGGFCSMGFRTSVGALFCTSWVSGFLW